MFFDRHRVVRATFDGRVVGDDGHFFAFDRADPGDDAGRGRVVVVHAVGGQRRELEERRARVEQPLDALARQQLAATAVTADGCLAATAACLAPAWRRRSATSARLCSRLARNSSLAGSIRVSSTPISARILHDRLVRQFRLSVTQGWRSLACCGTLAAFSDVQWRLVRLVRGCWALALLAALLAPSAHVGAEDLPAYDQRVLARLSLLDASPATSQLRAVLDSNRVEVHVSCRWRPACTRATAWRGTSSKSTTRWVDVDDTTLAAVIAHEATHAQDAVSGYLSSGGASACIDSEVRAFRTSALFWLDQYGAAGKLTRRTTWKAS